MEGGDRLSKQHALCPAHTMYRGHEGSARNLLTRDQLVQMSRVDISEVDKDTLVDLQSVTIDPTLSLEDRISRFLKNVKNPYVFRCGETAVHITFKQSGPCLEQLLQTHFIVKKE